MYYKNVQIILLCEKIYEKNFIHIKTKNFQQIIIGRDMSSDIIYNNSLIKKVQAKIFFNNGKLMLENFENHYGVFLNDKPVGNRRKLLFNGDEQVELFSEKDFFARAPRIVNKIERERVIIEAPPQKQEKDDRPLIYTIGPSFIIGIVMIISMASTISGITNGNESIQSTIISALMTVAMLISMILFPIINNKYEKRRQKNILFNKYLSAQECAKIIADKSSRMWERRIEDDDFLKIRVGLGDIPIEADIEYPNKEFSMEDDNLVELIKIVAKKI